ncbi:MAG TPA: hypothetical protein VIO15_13195 [Bacteroidales bacterium]
MQAESVPIKIKKGFTLFTLDQSISAANDTVIFLPVNQDFYITKTSSIIATNFFLSLKQKAFKRRWSKSINNVVISTPDSIGPDDTIKVQKAEIPFINYQNLIIRDINVSKLNIFGPSFNNPNDVPRNVFERWVNRTHVTTREYFIKQYLLFKKNSRLDPYQLAESERLLRELPFIEDARVYIYPTSSPDSVDVEVVTKDTWSVGFDFTTANIKDYELDVWNQNLMGTGSELDNVYFKNSKKIPVDGLKGSYTIRNISGSFINTLIGYEKFGNESFRINFWRDFFTQQTRYAGQVYFENIEKRYVSVEQDTGGYVFFPLKGTVSRLWLGRAFKLPTPLISATTKTSFSIAGGLYQYDYTKAPLVRERYRYEFQNRTFYLLSYSLASYGYYRSSLVYNFGRTEDIPYGLLIKTTQGLEVGEFGNRYYHGVSFLNGGPLLSLGFFYFDAAVGGFIKKKEVEQGVLNVGGNYISNLLVIGRIKARAFINVDFIKGFKRYEDEYLDINNFSGVRGFYNDSARGGQRLVINMESVFFTPWYAGGFRFAPFAFADFAYVGSTRQWIFRNNLYSGFGIGLRLRNEHFVFKTFQIKLAYYPFLSKKASGDLFTLSQEWRFRPNDFTVRSPEILIYK